ncbi:ankyrin [Colletotrichum falcatum]|nr:ankyrin [Colletotrichum falcatum]
MWLIDTGTLELVGVQGDPRQSYAILSHTWGGDEVTFQSFKAMSRASDGTKAPAVPDEVNDTRSRSGLQKIRDAADLARGHGYGYIWADTCCIDKTSSAELSESINSMYRWYQNAAVCYAYLSDVEPADTQDPFSEDSSFRSSRWFTRGWTLQELIAPRTVEFYARNWSYIGRKSSEGTFCELVADITGIRLQVLAGTTSVADVSVANKMRWAARRQTTRPEDIAYCMMGLFNVNMPLLYGEGERAFVRLQEEILKETDDQSLFLWGLPPEDSANADGLFGLLAKSPESFSRVEVGYVRPLPPSESHESSPASVTSQGLRTNLLLIPVRPESDDYYAVLDCVVLDPMSSVTELSPHIILRRLWSDQFARVNSKEGSVILLPQEQSDEAEGSYESIYVRQKPFHALPELRVRSKYLTTPGTKDDRSVPFTINGAHPPERWDAALSVLRTKEPQSGSTIAVLRFESNEPGYAPTFNMTIGLHRVQGRWEVCCQKHPDVGDSLESVYLKTPQIPAVSEAASYQVTKGLGHITIDTKEYQRRGRRFVLLEVSLMPELNIVPSRYLSAGTTLQPVKDLVPSFDEILRFESSTAPSRDSTIATNSSLPAGDSVPAFDEIARPELDSTPIQALNVETVPPFDEITAATRQCCYEEKLSDVLSPAVETRDGVRTGFSGNFASRLDNEIRAVRIGRDRPYAALVHAIRTKDDGAVQDLVKKDRSILEMEADEFDQFRAIHWAAAFGSQSTMKTLTRLGVIPRSRTASGFMAVHLAVLSGNLGVAADMLEEERSSYLERARTTPSPMVFPGEPNLTLYDPLGNPDIFHKSTTGKLETILHLLSAYIQSGWANQGFRLLIEHIKEDFLGHHSFPHANCLGELPIHRAAATGSIQALEALVSLTDTSRQINARDDAGRSVLFHAACGGHVKVITKLVSLGAMLDVGDDHGRSPLHAAVMAGKSQAVKALLELNAAANNVTHALGLTALHLACLYGSTGCVIEILKSPDSGSVDANRWTTGGGALFQPLHLAVANGCLEAVSRLLKAGCETEGRCDGYLELTTDDAGKGYVGRLCKLEEPKTPMELALHLNQKDIGAELRRFQKGSRWSIVTRYLHV